MHTAQIYTVMGLWYAWVPNYAYTYATHCDTATLSEIDRN